MKKLIATIAVSAFAFFGTAVESDARPNYGGYGHQSQSSQVYVSGYRHGRPVYTRKVFVGYDRCNRPVYQYRTVSAPSRGYGGYHRGHNNRCNTGYNNYGSYGGHRSSGSSVSFTFRR